MGLTCGWQASRVSQRDGPDAAEITRYIVETFEGVDVARDRDIGIFFSRDPEKHWPNFATIVTSDQYDQFSQLHRPGLFRLNIGVGKATFLATVGSVQEPDYTQLDRLMPHPVYAKQRWICILNPSQETFDEVVTPLLAEAYARIGPR
jgi:hypothetical protein